MNLDGQGSARSTAGASFPFAARREPPAFAWILLFVYAAALLAIGLTRDWRLQHEDNGALHTSFARAHLDLGLARTRAHDLFFTPRTGEGFFYSHHPPATSLVLAGAFALTGCDAPWVARAVAIAFHLGSLALFVGLLRIHLPPALALCGGVLFATVPMSTYFGRMVNYEVLCLTGVLLQLFGYARWKTGHARSGFGLLALGILFGGLVDWPAFFFAAALGLAEALAALRGERAAWRGFVAIGAVASAVLAVDLTHLVIANGSLRGLIDVLGSKQEGVVVTVASFVEHELAYGRRYFGRAAVLSSVLVVAALVLPRAPLATTVAATAQPRILARWLGASGVAALAYILAAPSWAIVHAYWSFYFLPFVVTSLVLVLGALAESWARGGLVGWIAALVGALLVLDVGNTALRTLLRRHGSPEPYAIERTRELRRDNIPPRSWVEAQTP